MEDNDSKKPKDDKEEEETEKSNFSRLADIVGKFVDQSQTDKALIEKRFATIEEKLDKALETPAPAQENTPDAPVKLNNEYNDGGADSQASEDPKDADSEGEGDKVQIEEKTEDVVATAKSDQWTKPVRSGQQSTASDSNAPSNPILSKARELGPEGLGDLANLINKGSFGNVNNQSGQDSRYPEV